VRWSPEARKGFKASIRGITGRTSGVSPRQVTGELTHHARRTLNYHLIGVNFAGVRELDRWIRRRMRLYYRKQWKRPRTRRRKLPGPGIRPDEVHPASRSRKGPWRMSRN